MHAMFRDMGGPYKVVGCLKAPEHSPDEQAAAAELLEYLCRMAHNTLWEIEFCRDDVVDLLVAAIVQSARTEDWELMDYVARIMYAFIHFDGMFEEGTQDEILKRQQIAAHVQWRSPVTGRTTLDTRLELFKNWKQPGYKPPENEEDVDPVNFCMQPLMYFKVLMQQKGCVEALVGALKVFYRRMLETVLMPNAREFYPAYKAAYQVGYALHTLVSFESANFRDGESGEEEDEVHAFDGDLAELIGRSFRAAKGPELLVQLATYNGPGKLDGLKTSQQGDKRMIQVPNGQPRQVFLGILMELIPDGPMLHPRAAIALDILDAGFVEGATREWLSKRVPNNASRFVNTGREAQQLEMLRILAKYTNKAKVVMGALIPMSDPSQDTTCIEVVAARLPKPGDLTQADHRGRLMLSAGAYDYTMSRTHERSQIPKDVGFVLRLLAELGNNHPFTLATLRQLKVHTALVKLLCENDFESWEDEGSKLLAVLLQDDAMRNSIVGSSGSKHLQKLLRKYARDTWYRNTYLDEHYTLPILKRLCGHGIAWEYAAANYVIWKHEPRDPGVPNSVPRVAKITTPSSGDWMLTNTDPSPAILNTNVHRTVNFDKLANQVLADEDVLLSAAIYNPSPSFHAALRLLQLINAELDKDLARAGNFPAHLDQPREFTEEEMKEVERRKKWEAALPRIQALFSENALWQSTIDDACNRAEALLGAGGGRGNVLFEYEYRNWQERVDNDDWQTSKRQNVGRSSVPPTVSGINTGVHSPADLVAYVQLHKAWLPGYAHGAGI